MASLAPSTMMTSTVSLTLKIRLSLPKSANNSMRLESKLTRHNYVLLIQKIYYFFNDFHAMEKIIILHNSYSKTHTKIQISVNRGIEKSKLE